MRRLWSVSLMGFLAAALGAAPAEERPGVMTLPNNVALTADFRLPKAVTLKPGGTYEMQVKKLSDGLRGVTRNVYWTEPGEYTLSVSYQLSDQQGNKTLLLKSEPVKIT